jgi:predicted SnoaL-like aldol condensation-catalyzing enzyme
VFPYTNRDAAQMQDSTEQNKSLIRQMFQDVLERDAFDETVIARYFSPSYIQHADGKTLDYAGLVNHVREVKRTATKLRFIFEQMLAEGNRVMDIHRVEGGKRTGGRFAVRLFSLWVIEDGKIVLCDELSHVVQGEAGDRDLSSRTSKR